MLQVFVPTVIYVLLIGFLGLYVSSAIFIAFFMAWLGKYPLYKIVPVAVLIPVALFFMFEVWFLVPLPEGTARDRARLLSRSRSTSSGGRGRSPRPSDVHATACGMLSRSSKPRRNRQANWGYPCIRQLRN